ncbi:MAG TPA: GGDEF domain-containing protein [Burkholderiales bacterium]
MGLIFAVALAAVSIGPSLPQSFAGLRTAGPYAVLITAMGLAWWFNRGRGFVIASSLLLGWMMMHHFPGKAVYTAAVVLVPLNWLAAVVGPERGVRYGAGYRWAAILAVELVLAFWFSRLSISFDQWWLRSPPTPFVGRVVFAAAFVAALWRAYGERRPMQIAQAGALVAFFVAAEWADRPPVYGAFMAAAGVMLLVALLQESHQLVFRDELTGLLGRRALHERLRSLGPRYALAMVDIDHFKQFNDAHGHQVGDQVLKLVAGRLAKVAGGGIAYRYGGEEFSVLFPDRDAAEARPHLEAVRGAIEHYRMAVRAGDRPKDPDDTVSLRLKKSPLKTLSVTISIGVAEPGSELRTPTEVLRAADEALYRAKEAGRNRLST